MELGAGMGLCGLMIALMVPDCTIELTDLPNELQDLMRLNVKRQDVIIVGECDRLVPCAAIGIKSDYTGMPYDVIIGANVVVLPYNLVALARTLLSGPWTRVYISGKA